MEKTTLVIHPKDTSTDFLARIYKDKDWDIIKSWPGTPANLKRFMDCYDRIIMMGHGTPSGLLNVGSFYKDELMSQLYVIDNYFVDLCRQKKQYQSGVTVTSLQDSTNCQAFHTGMIISEVCEAQYVFGKTPLTVEETLDNMNLFADVVGKHIDNPKLLEMQKLIREEYNRDDPVSLFNRENIIMLDTDGKDLVEEEICQIK